MADVRVMILVPAEKALRTSARRIAMAATTKLTDEPKSVPSIVDLDNTFAPVPIARTGFTATLALATPNKAPQFVVRGSVPQQHLEALAATPGLEVYADPRIAAFPVCPNDPAVGTKDDVATALGFAKLHDKGLTGAKVAVAIMDTGVNVAHLQSAGMKPKLNQAVTWAPAGVAKTPGSYDVAHGSMCAYDALIGAPEATLLDFPILQSRTPGGSTMDGFLSDAVQAYSYLLQQMRSTSWSYDALVINNSWGMYSESWDFPKGDPGRYADNPNHPFNTIVGVLSRAGVDILFAAGNCGAPCPAELCGGVTANTIMGANAHPDVLTVAGATYRNERVGYSSQGPAIPGMKHTKPDLTCYTHFMGSQALGANVPDNGTSAACPVAAGCIAALRSKVPTAHLAPSDLMREVLADTRQPDGSAGWNPDLGYGILNVERTAARLLIA